MQSDKIRLTQRRNTYSNILANPSFGYLADPSPKKLSTVHGPTSEEGCAQAKAVPRRDACFPRFLDLSYELRHEVYRHYAYEDSSYMFLGPRTHTELRDPCVHSDEITDCESPDSESTDCETRMHCPTECKPLQLFPNICLVNRTTGQESASYFVSMTEFTFMTHRAIPVFSSILQKLYDGYLFHKVRKLSIKWYKESDRPPYRIQNPAYPYAPALPKSGVYSIDDLSALMPLVDRCPELRVLRLRISGGWTHPYKVTPKDLKNKAPIRDKDMKAITEIGRKFMDMVAPAGKNFTVEVYYQILAPVQKGRLLDLHSWERLHIE